MCGVRAWTRAILSMLRPRGKFRTYENKSSHVESNWRINELTEMQLHSKWEICSKMKLVLLGRMTFCECAAYDPAERWKGNSSCLTALAWIQFSREQAKDDPRSNFGNASHHRWYWKCWERLPDSVSIVSKRGASFAGLACASTSTTVFSLSTCVSEWRQSDHEGMGRVRRHSNPAMQRLPQWCLSFAHYNTI